MEKIKEARHKIQSYIKRCGYTWTVDVIIEQYQKKQRGEYISFTAKDVVSRFDKELDILTSNQ